MNISWFVVPLFVVVFLGFLEFVWFVTVELGMGVLVALAFGFLELGFVGLGKVVGCRFCLELMRQVHDLQTHKVHHHGHMFEFCFKDLNVGDLHQILVRMVFLVVLFVVGLLVVFLVFVVFLGFVGFLPGWAVELVVIDVAHSWCGGWGVFGIVIVQSRMGWLIPTFGIIYFGMFEHVYFPRFIFLNLGPNSILLDEITSGATMLDFRQECSILIVIADKWRVLGLLRIGNTHVN